MCPNATKVLAVTEELPDESAVRSTTVSIGRAQLAARVDISYKSVIGDADEILDHAPSRGYDDQLGGTFMCVSNHLFTCRTTFLCRTTWV